MTEKKTRRSFDAAFKLQVVRRRLNKAQKAFRQKLRCPKYHGGLVQQPVSFRASPKRNFRVRLFGVGNYHPQDCGSNPKTRSS